MDLSPGRSEHGRRLAADIDVGNGNGGAPRIVCLRCVRRTLSVVTAAREEECSAYRYMVVLIVLLFLLYCHSHGAGRHPRLPMYSTIYPWLTSLACLASVAIRANGKG